MPSWRGIGIGCESIKKQPGLSESGRSELNFQRWLPTRSRRPVIVSKQIDAPLFIISLTHPSYAPGFQCFFRFST